MTDQAQVVGGGGAGLVLVHHRGHADVHGDLGDLLVQRRQRFDEFLQLRIAGVGFAELVHHLGELAQLLALIHQHLAAEQVDGLDAVGAFIDLRDAAVAHQLFHAPFADEAVAAEHLHAHIGGGVAVVGHERLGDRGQQRDQVGGVLAGGVVGRLFLDVQLQRQEGGQCTAGFGVRLLRQQHAADVRVDDDRVGRLFRSDRAVQRTHLQAFPGIGQRALECGFAEAQTLHAAAEAGCVHHGEHAGQALVLLADQVAARAIQIDDGRGIGLDAHLVFERAAEHGIAFAERTVCVDQELRHDEQRDALHVLRRIRQAGQHQVNDVVAHVMFAGRDKDLGAGDADAAVIVRLGAGLQQAEVGAAMRLGQTHGAGPVAGDDMRQIGGLLFVGAVGVDGRVRAMRQARVHRPGDVGRALHFHDREAQHLRHALTAVFRITIQTGEAQFAELLVGFLETGRRLHAVGSGVEQAAFLVGGAVDRRQFVFAELGSRFQIRGKHVGGGFFIARQGRDDVLHLDQLVQHEVEISQRRFVGRHVVSPDTVDVDAITWSTSLR